MTAVLGLDIGGSTTRAVRAEDGRCVAEARAGSANIRSVGAAEAGRQLDAVLAGIRTDDVAAACAGAAGGDSAPARAFVPGQVQSFIGPRRTRVERERARQPDEWRKERETEPRSDPGVESQGASP